MISWEAVRAPVLGLYFNFVELVYSVVRFPAVAEANNGYRVAFVVVSSVTVAYAVGVVQVGVPEPALVKTCPDVPVEELTVRAPVKDNVVK